MMTVVPIVFYFIGVAAGICLGYMIRSRQNTEALIRVINAIKPGSPEFNSQIEIIGVLNRELK